MSSPSKEIDLLIKEIASLKKDLKRWEIGFEKRHGRKASIEDVSQRKSIEKHYKKYQKMKKELQSLKENVKSSKPGSPEQITSPNIKKSTSKGLPLDDCIDPKLKATPAEKVSVKEFEELKALVNSPGYVFSQGGVTADDFWLSPSSSSTPPSGSTSGKPDLRASASQPLPSDHVKSPVSVEEPPKASTQQPKKLILGGPQRHLPQLSKRFHPFLGRRSRSYTQQEEEPKKQKPKKTPKQRVPLVLDDDDDSDLFEMEEHVIDPFRHYDPALFRWDDPNFSIGPGFFMSNKACISFAVPFLADPVRKEKVLKKLEKGTLGEPTAENYAMEEDIDEELKEFIKNNTVDYTSLEAASILPVQQKKKTTKRRQTKLLKLKFVEKR